MPAEATLNIPSFEKYQTSNQAVYHKQAHTLHKHLNLMETEKVMEMEMEKAMEMETELTKVYRFGVRLDQKA